MPNKLRETEEKIFCKNCGKELKENEKPCPYCGCKSRIYKVEAIIHIKLRASLKWKHRHPGFKRPIAEGVSRESKVSKDPKLDKLEVNESYTVDREHNLWIHDVIDTKTGGRIYNHYEREPLNQHKSHIKKKRK